MSDAKASLFFCINFDKVQKIYSVMKMEKTKKETKAYKTYALADRDRVDKKTKTARPSVEQVENMRDWSIEKKN